MQSRRDHVQAHQFSVGRLVRAAATGDTTSGELPGRRANTGMVIGTVLAVLVCGGALILGLISPKATESWSNPGAIIVDKTTGSRYLYVGGALRPVLNYASALLAAGQDASVQMVAHSTLAGVPVGPPIGIPGAPDALPAASAMLPDSWALCLEPDGGVVVDLAPAGRTSAAARGAILVAPPPGSPASPSAAPPQQGEYVLWGATKYPVTDQAVLPALGLGDHEPIPASPVWLAALPTGAALAPAEVPGSGDPGPQIAGASESVGQVFQTSGNGVEQYYVLRADGLAPIGATEAALFSSVPGSAPPVDLTPAQVAAAPSSSDRSLLDRLPDLVSSAPYADTGASLCVLQHSPGAGSAAQLTTEDPADVSAARPVVVPPGGGMLADPPGPQPLSGATPYLITDSGEKFLIDSTAALDSLGYSALAVNTLPAAVLALIPSGPVLDTATAQKEAT